MNADSKIDLANKKPSRRLIAPIWHTVILLLILLIVALGGTHLQNRKSTGEGIVQQHLTNNPEFPHEIFRSGYSKAVCKTNWKLYIIKKSKKQFLFDLSADMEEKNDLSSRFPDKVNELMRALDDWEKTQTVKPSWPGAADVLIEVKGKDYYFPS
jgi:hypothetical protein